MKRGLVLILSLFLTQLAVSQDKEHYNLKLGLNADYSYSGSTHTITAGPAMFWEKEIDPESEFLHALTVDAGFYWSQQMKVSPVTSVGYYMGHVPGLIFGVSSQQYYNMLTKQDNQKTDVRLSGEVIFSFFGFLGYRYQHPIISKNEGQELSRHAFLLRIPISVKTVSKKS